MKKYFYLLSAMLMMTATFTSCGDDDEVITENTKVLTFEGDKFTALIDNPQYGGALIYSADEYKWTDTGNTELSGECVKADWTQWGLGYGWSNGVAISNYINADVANHSDYTEQLTIPASNGSDNFAVVWDNDSKLTFADGAAYVVKSMQVINTNQALASINAKKGEGYKFTVTVTADNGASKEIVLAEGTEAVENWTTVDLSSLGKVKSLTFTFDGTDKSTYNGVTSLNTPKYVAIDNIVVVK